MVPQRNICWIEEPFPKSIEKIVISDGYNENEVNDEDRQNDMRAISSKSRKTMGEFNPKGHFKKFKNCLIHMYKTLG